ncbi:MAG: preprotein translocase subunit SecA, partial [Dysgonamonadaceae bacterium]|nr:preprotein translocase subunit SecA [Dysgonamonadaceae bacterium]
MNFNDILSKLFGNKAQRDLKEISPYVEKIKAVYPDIEALTNDELRARTEAIKQKIEDTVKTEKDTISELKVKIETLELEDRENVWAEIDKIEKEILVIQEKVLDEVMPEVFAIVKDTARRFKENEQTVVTATDFDRQLALTHDFVSIDG